MYHASSQQSLSGQGAAAPGTVAVKEKAAARRHEGQNWLWSMEYFEHNSPSRCKGMSFREERMLRAKVSKYIQDSGMNLKL